MAPRPPLPPFIEETARRRIFGPRPEGERGQSFPVR
jgi:hypothetical protein